jgi:hypothetical protein
LPHIVLTVPPAQEQFQRRGGGPEEPLLPHRDRQTHAQLLLRDLQRVQEDAKSRSAESPLVSAIGGKTGLHVQFELEGRFIEALKSLEDRRKKIELVATQESGDHILATVYVPRGELKTFERKIEKYATVNTPGGRPTHERLIAPLGAIRLAALRAFWTDTEAVFPLLTETIRWEIWIRDDAEAVAQFEAKIVAAGVELSPSHLNFPERLVYLARGTAEQLTASIEVVDAIAELRLAKESREFFIQLRGPEAKEWADDLVGRLDRYPDPSAICLLDSGLNAGHPLLELFSEPEHRLAPLRRGDQTIR